MGRDEVVERGDERVERDEPRPKRQTGYKIRFEIALPEAEKLPPGDEPALPEGDGD
jgi:hypothetical protein